MINWQTIKTTIGPELTNTHTTQTSAKAMQYSLVISMIKHRWETWSQQLSTRLVVNPCTWCQSKWKSSSCRRLKLTSQTKPPSTKIIVHNAFIGRNLSVNYVKILLGERKNCIFFDIYILYTNFTHNHRGIFDPFRNPLNELFKYFSFNLAIGRWISYCLRFCWF